jgi:hypothetical protein
MKRTIILLTFMIVCFAVQSQNKAQVNGAEIKFENQTFDFGNLKIGDVKVGTYTFTNSGNKPLILDDVKTSCDCTTIEYPKAPIMPGKTGVIKVTYTAKDPGQINKWITVLSNAQSFRVVLKTKGNVVSSES